jgi:protein-tyrosine-phosphatase
LDSFAITFVCTGNRFRSPLAEAFVRRLTEGLPVTTQSFGSLQLVDAPALPEAIELARGYGIDLTIHRTRWVGDAKLADMDLVLGFEVPHVQQAVVDAGASRDRSFTIRHFARLLQAVDTRTLGDGIALARTVVERVARLAAEDQFRQERDTMRDPFGAPSSIQLTTANEIRDLSVLLASKLFGVNDGGALQPISPTINRRRWLPWRR